jgi:hypothetical protein
MRRSLSAVSGKRRKKAHTAHRTTHRRKRRISGIGGMDLKGIGLKVAGLGVGSIGARELNTILVKQFPSLTPMISGFIQIAVGVFLPVLVKGSKFMADVGDGMIANGMMVEAVNLGLISGVSPNSSMTYRINGPGNIRAIAGTSPNGLRTIAGKGDLNAVAGVQRRKMVSGCY